MSKQRSLRLLGLVTILGLLLFAFWYDYKVARPGVDQAFDRVLVLNDKINSSAENSSMTSKEVQQAVGFNPTYTITKGDYQVEVYAWTAGLPFRSHDLYAVYTGEGNNLKFMRHYKFTLPVEELKPKKRVPGVASVDRPANTPDVDPREAINHRDTDPALDRDTPGFRQDEAPGVMDPGMTPEAP